jgi:tetratricopeptide (TPR) repeat protein
MKSSRVNKFAKGILLVIVVTGLLALFLPQNLQDLEILKSLANHDRSQLTRIMSAVNFQPQNDCGAAFWLGNIELELGNKESARPIWEGLLKCSKTYSGIVKAIYSSDMRMAEQFIRDYPDDPQGYYWLAPLYVKIDNSKRVALFYQGLELDPTNGALWCLVGDNQIILKNIPEAASAYANCCLNRDPNDEGCLKAGNSYLKLGDMNKAIEYYSRSLKPSIRALGQDLENQIQGGSK